MRNAKKKPVVQIRIQMQSIPMWEWSTVVNLEKERELKVQSWFQALRLKRKEKDKRKENVRSFTETTKFIRVFTLWSPVFVSRSISSNLGQLKGKTAILMGWMDIKRWIWLEALFLWLSKVICYLT